MFFNLRYCPRNKYSGPALQTSGMIMPCLGKIFPTLWKLCFLQISMRALTLFEPRFSQILSKLGQFSLEFLVTSSFIPRFLDFSVHFRHKRSLSHGKIQKEIVEEQLKCLNHDDKHIGHSLALDTSIHINMNHERQHNYFNNFQIQISNHSKY